MLSYLKSSIEENFVKTITGILGIILVIFSLAGCKSQTHQPKVTPKTHTIKKGPVFVTGIPQRLQGKYYYAKVTQNSIMNDEFWELKIQAGKLSLNCLNDDYNGFEWRNVKTSKVSDDIYILKGDDRYIKIVLLADHKLSISSETQFDFKTARSDKELMTLSPQKPTGYFGTVTKKLIGKFYVSERGIERYYAFQEFPMGNQLRQVDPSGKLQVLANYQTLHGKINGYTLGNMDNDNDKLLVPISDSQLQDAQTGEIFTHYPKSEYELNKAIRQKFGLGPEVVPGSSYENETTNEQPQTTDEYPKTFDFADDKDDDYYDTYDDFGLNDGD